MRRAPARRGHPRRFVRDPGLACEPRCRCPPPSSPTSTASTSGTPSPSSRAGSEEDFPIIERAEGTTLYDTQGNAYIDGVSSLWCNVHGHRHPAIDIAIKDQLDRVAHSTMLGLSHAPAAKLAKRLVDLAPDGPEPRLLLRQRLDRVRDRAEDGLPVPPPARRVVALGLRLPARQLPRRHARLGLGGRHRALPLALPPAALRRLAGASPATPTRCARCWPSTPSAARRSSSSRSCRARPASTCTPTATCAPCASCATSSALFLICDEVATGFGRTGTMFACEHEGVDARPHVRGQGAHRRLPAAGRDADHRAHLRGLPRPPRAVPHLLPRPHLHRQPAGLRGGAGDAAASSSRSTRSSACSRRSSCWASCSPSTSRACRRCARSAGAASWSASSCRASRSRPASATR